MKAVAVVLSYGRESLADVLGCFERQTRPIPVLVWLDDAPHVHVDASELVDVVHGPRLDRSDSIGLVRRLALERAVYRHQLQLSDAIVVLDDDDFYSSRHVELTLQQLDGAHWTGALAMGLSLDGRAPEYVRSTGGCGQHATWAFRLAHYDRAGGYQDERYEDTGLALRMGWSSCSAHTWCTHVRRHHAAQLSEAYDRAAIRRKDRLATTITPRWTSTSEYLESWCTQHLQPDQLAR